MKTRWFSVAKKTTYGLLLSVMISACNVPTPVENMVESLKRIVSGGSKQPLPEETKAAKEVAVTKANAELMAEMLQVVFNKKEVDDDSQYTSLVSSLNQGASLEGIYRGLVMGSQYRVLESKAKAASPNAIKFFALELAEIQGSMKNPTVFTKETAKQAPSIDYPDGESTPDSYTFGETSTDPDAKKTKEQRTEELLQDFIGATPFTLKRVMADEVLKKMDEMKDNVADLAQWYAGATVRLVNTGTDFGLPQRNSADFDFHSKFARTMSIDRVKWEAINRYHRIINRLE